MIRIGIIGTGIIVQEFIQSINQIEELTVTCLYSRSLSRAQEFQKITKLKNVNLVTNFDDMLQTIDSVYIASPNGLHYEQAKFFLQAHKHVLLEKPTCFSSTELIDLQNIANQNKCILLEAFKTFYLPNFDILQKELSTIKPFVANFQWNKYSSRMEDVLENRYYSVFDFTLGKGNVYDALIYPVELAIGLFGPVKKVLSVGQKLDNNVQITNVVTLVHKINVITSIVCTKAAESFANSEIIGINETLTFNHLTQLLNLQKNYRLTKKIKNLSEQTNKLPMIYEIKFFLKLIIEKNLILMNQQLQKSLLALEVLETVQRKSYLISFYK